MNDRLSKFFRENNPQNGSVMSVLGQLLDDASRLEYKYFESEAAERVREDYRHKRDFLDWSVL